MRLGSKRFPSLAAVVLSGAVWACTSLQQRDQWDTERSAGKTSTRQRRMPDKPAPPTTIIDAFNDDHSPVPDQYSPERRTAGLDRSSATNLRVDSIVVTPTQLSMTAGDTVSLRGKGTLTWVARDTARRVVKDFWPVFSVSDRTVLRVERSQLTALAPGMSDLLVSAMKLDSASRTLRVFKTTRVHVVVK